jgi:membrane protein
VRRWSWIKDRLFARDPKDLVGMSGVVVRAGRLVYLTVGYFRRDFGLERAASLTFASIVSLIPLVVLFFGFSAALGGSETGVNWVVDTVMPLFAPDNEEFRVRVKSWMLDDISHGIFETGSAGIVNLTAILGLVVVSLGIFITSERVFNRIWKVQNRRSIVQKVTAFWVILTTSPFLIIASIWIGDVLVPEGGAIKSLTEQSALFDTLYRFLVPATIGFFAFTLIFLFLPATRVRIRSAALGALLTAALWQFSKKAFAIYLFRVGEMTEFYKPLASVPLFLIWIYVTWIVVLLGGTISYVHQNLDLLSRLRRQDDTSRRFSTVFLGTYLLSRIVRRFGRGEPLLGIHAVAGEIGAQAEELEDVAHRLVDHGVLVADAESDGVYTLARHPRSVRVRDVVEQLRREEHPADAEALGFGAAPIGSESGTSSGEILQLPEAGDGDALVTLLTASDAAALAAFGDQTLEVFTLDSAPSTDAESASEGVDASAR